MEQVTGLTSRSEAEEVGEQSGWNPENWFQDDNGEVSDNVWEKIGNGKSGHVGVNLNGEYLAEGHGPNDEPLKTDSRGTPYLEVGDKRDGLNPDNINNSFNPPRYYLNDESNHAVVFGRTEDGQRYIYNPYGTPPLLRERKGDSASSEAIDRMSKNLMARKGDGDYHAKLTQYDK
ncbi:MAG: hypothetical protein HYV63_06460 [Candidatus Schekmanbacteria bacterium]|nr:hypothetical protein [Candidatus Schekmanbacteria bacterium]